MYPGPASHAFIHQTSFISSFTGGLEPECIECKPWVAHFFLLKARKLQLSELQAANVFSLMSYKLKKLFLFLAQ